VVKQRPCISAWASASLIPKITLRSRDKSARKWLQTWHRVVSLLASPRACQWAPFVPPGGYEMLLIRRAVVLLTAAALLCGIPTEGYAARQHAIGTGDPNCPHGGNYVSTACFYGITQVQSYAEWTNVNMTASAQWVSNGGHINHTIWAYSGDSCNDWVEEGVTLGFKGSNILTYYYAYDTLTSGGLVIVQSNPASFGEHQWYRLDWVGDYGGSQSYDIYRQGLKLNSIPIGGLGFGSCISAVGLEIQKDPIFPQPPGIESSSDTFDATPLTWKDSGGTWHTGYVNTMYWIDYPCDGTNLHCLNGVYEQGNSAWWKSNKVR
jgi:hypothetical protein